MESRFPRSSSCCLGWHVQDLHSEFQARRVVLSPVQSVQRCLLRRCRCHTCSSRTSGGILVPMRCSSAAFSVLAWPVTSPTARSVIPLDWLSSTSGLSGRVCLPSWRASAISLDNASIGSLSLPHLSVTLWCPGWSTNFPALCAMQGNSVPFLGTSIAHVILSLRSRMTNTGVTCPPGSLSKEPPCPLTNGAHLPNHVEHPISCVPTSHHVPSHRRHESNNENQLLHPWVD